ncbi:DUF5979 domain-containing protein [Paeniglutamicibacter sp. R2-26]|uniref:DUF5979 domain-containing protein n=1 Tax=Paeniglutamicibacter sp. R2-26 TaxID=3144417 RepID=UPI003EE7C525
MWKNGIVRSTVAASATAALVAAMMFGGGGFNPAVAAPADTQESGTEQQLRDAVEESGTTAVTGAAKDSAQPGIPADAKKPAAAPKPTETPASGPATKAAEESPKSTPAASKKTDEPSTAPKSAGKPAASLAGEAKQATAKTEAPVEKKKTEAAARTAGKAGVSEAPAAGSRGRCEAKAGKFEQRIDGGSYTPGLVNVDAGSNVYQRVPLSGLKSGSNELTFRYTARAGGVDAIEYIDGYSLTNGSVDVTNEATVGGTTFVTLNLNATSAEATLSYVVHISPEAGMNGPSSNGVDIQVQLDSLGCATIGNKTLNIKVKPSTVQPPKTTSVKIKKELTGETKAVDPDRTYSGTVTCTYNGKTVTGTWEKQAGDAATEVAFASGAKAAVGSDCTATESELTAPSTDPSYVFETPAIAGLKNLGKNGGTIVVTNKVKRLVGDLYVTKTVVDPYNGFWDFGLPVFEVNYVCSNPSDTGARTIEGSRWIRAGGTRTIQDIPFGWNCEFNETTPSQKLLRGSSYTWGSPVVDRPAVTMGAKADGSTVAVTNTVGRGAGSLEINKSLEGDLVGNIDEGITYTGTWSCTYGETAQHGDWSLEAGDSEVVATDLLAGSECTVAENATQQGPNAKDASYVWLPASFTGNRAKIAANETSTVGVVNSVERKLGSLNITKKLSGETAGFTGGENEAFTISYTCVNPLDDKAAPVVGSVLLAAGGTKSVGSIPFGWDCGFSETAPGTDLLKDGSFAWNTPEIDRSKVSMDAGTNGSAVTVTNSIGREHGELEIGKRVAGDLAGNIDEGITYAGTWTCTYGETTERGDWSLEAGESEVVASDLLAGSECTVAEKKTEQAPNAKDASYYWLPAAFEGNNATIGADSKARIDVVNSVGRELGALSVTKKLIGETAGFIGGETEGFQVNYTCANPLDEKAAPVAGSVLLAAGGTKTVGSVPFGWDCEFAESTPGADLLEDASFIWGTPEIDRAEVSMDGETDGSIVTVTNSIERNLGAVDVAKSVGSTDYLGDGKWKITYDITVTNQQAAQSIYTLTDKLSFGEGLVVESARYQQSGGDWADWLDTGVEAVLAADRKIEPAQGEQVAQHTYQVEVVASVPAGIIGSDEATCDAGDESAGGGFLNIAAATAGEHNSVDTACATPMPTDSSYSLEKTSDPASGETVWPGEEIVYTVTVRNTGEFVYTGAIVTDEMSGWEDAATLDEESLKVSGGEITIEGSEIIWTVGDLAVGESKTLTYTVTVNAGAWDQILVNTASGNGDVPPSTTTHPTPEYHKLPEPPVVVPPVVEPPVTEKPTPELPGKETEVPEPPVVAEPNPELPGEETELPADPKDEGDAPTLKGKETQVSAPEQTKPLATTGSSEVALWVAGSAAMVMLLGAGLVAVSRRRKGSES